MKKLLLLLLVLLSPPGFADLYKCRTELKTAYQDKPCQPTQTQSVIPQQPHESSVHAAELPDNTVQIARDADGKIKRSEKAKNDFKAAHPCPAHGKRSGACPGYVIDHIKPLACGGADNPENMQWQTVEAGKEKDSWERDHCGSKQTVPKLSTPSRIPSAQTTSAGQDKTQPVYTGKRGGHYVMTKNGKKRYLGHKK